MYNVTVDRAAMREEVLGPLFQRHVVSLTGTVDDRWLASYNEVVKDSDTFQRYRLEPAKGMISFTCRASDGPEQVESFLDRLMLFRRDGQPPRDLHGRGLELLRGARGAVGLAARPGESPAPPAKRHPCCNRRSYGDRAAELRRRRSPVTAFAPSSRR